MHRNNNSSAINLLAKSISNSDKVRNRFVVAAIILATMMIFVTFTVGTSVVSNYRDYMIKSIGSSATIMLDHPTNRQIKQIEATSGTSQVGRMISSGRIITAQNDKKNWIPMSWHDASDWKNYIMPAMGEMTGNAPHKADEIMLSKAALKKLGIKAPKIGMTVTLKIKGTNGVEQKKFTLSGWVRTYKEGYADGSLEAFVSKAYYKDQGLTVRNAGTVDTSANIILYNSVRSALSRNVDLRQGQDFSYQSSLASESKTVGMFALAIAAAVGLMIVLGGYLLIYNIMYISVNRDIKFYGLLKTIGTSPKQLKTLIRKQIYRLVAIGMPVGIGLGLAFSFIVVPWLIKSTAIGGTYSVMSTKVDFSPAIFIGTVLFIILTIAMGSRKPAKIASRVSPTEAIRYSGTKDPGKMKKRSHRAGSLMKMARYNVFNKKKQAFLVFLSLFIGVMVLLLANAFVSSLNVNNYMKAYMPHDFQFESADASYHLSDKFVKEIKDTEGVERVYSTREGRTKITFDGKTFSPLLHEYYEESGSSDSYNSFIKSAVNQKNFGSDLLTLSRQYYGNAAKAGANLKAFKAGCEVILSGRGNLKSMVGRTITLKGKDGKQNIKVKIGAVADYTQISVASNSMIMGEPQALFVSDRLMAKLDPGNGTSFVDVDASAGREPAVRGQMNSLKKQLDEQRAQFTYSCRHDDMASFVQGIKALSVMGDSIGVLLLVIGLMNFVNLMVTGVYNRRQEFAVMESIGMTKRQLRKMLGFEGLIYAAVTLLLCLTVGSAMMYALSVFVVRLADYAVFSYPVILTVCLFAVIFAICLVMPGMVYKKASRETITERMREAAY